MNHLAKHTGIKKHECRICKQSFAHKTSLKLHYRWHAGSKPFECKVILSLFLLGHIDINVVLNIFEGMRENVYAERKSTRAHASTHWRTAVRVQSLW